MTRTKTVLIVVLLLVGLTLLFLPTIRILLDGATEEEIEAVRLELREMDIATDLDGLLAKLPDDPDLFETGEIYQDAFDTFAMFDDPIRDRVPIFNGDVKLHPDNPDFESVLNDSKLFLEANADALEKLLEASKAESARFDLDYAAGFEIELPHAQRLRDSIRLLNLRAIVAAAEGDTELVTVSTIAAFRIPNALRYEPTLISQLVRIALNSMASKLLSHVLTRTPLSPEQLERIDREIVPEHSHPAFRLGIEGELVIWARKLEQIANDFRTDHVDESMKPRNPAVKYLFSRINWSGWVQSNSLETHKYIRDFVNILDGEYEDQTVVYRLLALREHEIQSNTNFSKSIMPALARAGYAHIREMAYLRNAKTVIAIERYRLDNNGELPVHLSQLDQLEPDFAIDPFTGEPLLFRREKQGYVVYSVGSNFRDDGAELSEKLETDDRDWYLRVRR